MASVSDHLLRTMAAVPVESRVLDLECRSGEYTLPLVQLGFDVYACDHSEQHVRRARERIEEAAEGDVQRVSVAQPHALGYSDGFFDWIVAVGLLHQGSSRRELLDALDEARRVLAPGGWIYLAAPAIDPETNPRDDATRYAGDSGIDPAFTPGTLETLAHDVGFATAEEPAYVDDGDEARLHAIFRRVEERVAP